MGAKFFKLKPSSVILQYCAQHICWEASIDNSLHFLCSKPLKNNHKCKLCLQNTVSLEYVYICIQCRQYFCFRHFLSHIKLNIYWGNLLDANCTTTTFQIDTVFLKAVSDSMCRQFARNLISPSITVDKSEWSVNKQLFVQRCVGFMKARTIKEFS